MQAKSWRGPKAGLGSVGVIALACACLAAFSRPATASGTSAPTWGALYTQYLAAGTVGDCASCHAEATSAEGAYTWLSKQQYMAGAGPYLLDPRASCLSWLGGDMPPEGPSKYPRASRDFAAWASAGKLDN